MSTFRNSITVLLYPKDGFTISSVCAALSSVDSAEKLTCRDTVEQQDAKHGYPRLQICFRRCWWKMRIMNAAFGLKQPVDAAQSQKRSQDRIFDAQAKSRMDDEGCPNGYQQSDSSFQIIQERNSMPMNRRLALLLHELFVVLHPGRVSSICFACVTKYVESRHTPKEEI